MPLPNLPFKKLHPDATVPTRSNPDDAGLDLAALQHTVIPRRSWVTVPTGLATAIPPNHYGRIAPRSGLAANHGLDVLGGVIDSGYRGELKVVLYNPQDNAVVILKEDRIAQLIVSPIVVAYPELVEELPEGDSRGEGGFGSTGR